MPTISEINGVALSGIDAFDGKSMSAIANIDGATATSVPLPAQTGYLWNWCDPSSSTVGDTTVPDLTYQNYGTYSAYDNYLAGSSGPAIVDLSGTKCWYINGTSGADIVVTNNVRSGSINLWPVSGDYTTYTMEMWIRSNGSWISNGNLWNIGYNTATRVRIDSSSRIWTYPLVSKTTSGTLSTNTWHHIVWTMTSRVGVPNEYGTLVVYKNGSVMQTFTNINKNPSYTVATQFFGGYSSTREKQRFYLGLQRRYGIALTAAEVLSNYNREKADYGY